MTTKEWKKTITDEWLRQPGVKETYGIDPDKTFDEQFSAVSIESLLFYAQAYGLMVLEKIVGDKITELEERFNRLRPHTLSWYAEKIKAFQLNHTLPTDTDVYSEINEDAQVVKYCSLTEKNGILSAKIAGQKDGKPSRLEHDTVKKVSEYVARVKDAGVRVMLTSGDADKFSIKLLIHFDPLKDLTTRDIEGAVSTYLESMPFDGIYSNMALIDVIQKIDGVRIAEVLTSSASYGNNTPTDIISTYVPMSGYMELNKAEITFKSYSAI
jgi:flagellar capping protein